MQRYFVKTAIKNETIIKDTNQVHHIKHVMRMKVNDKIVVCDMDGNCFYMVIQVFEKDAIVLKVDQPLLKLSKHFHVTLAQALIRKDHFELVCQKATELGVNTLIPLVLDRSIIKLDEKTASKKQTRWQSIAKEASEQSQRQEISEVSGVMTLNEIDFSAYDMVLIPYEKEDTQSLKQVLKTVHKNSKIMIVIGPEGGFSPSEIDYLSQFGTAVTLGPRILRSETAAIYTLAALSYELEMSE